MVRIDPKYRMPLVDMFVVIDIQRSSFQFSSFSDSQITSEQRAPLAAFAARLPVFIRERAPEFCKILAFYTWKRVYAVAVDAMLGQGIVSDDLVSAMAAQLMGFIHPPAAPVDGMPAGIIVPASANFTNTVCHVK